jgi:hypothetical protein
LDLQYWLLPALAIRKKIFFPGEIWYDTDSVTINTHALGILEHDENYYMFGQHMIEGKAYHVHSSEENWTLHFSELTDDYLDFTGKYTRVLSGDQNEAPAIFIKDGKYYLLSSGCTGWRPNPGKSAVADNIM